MTDSSRLRQDIILLLNRYTWEGRVGEKKLDFWLANFEEQHREIALFALHRFMYFGTAQVRQLLHTAFHDNYKLALIDRIRRRGADTCDLGQVTEQFERELKATRFIGMGGPSESGEHLLYYFRQENLIPTELFITADEIRPTDQVWRYVFIDDISASGSQAIRYSRDVLSRFPTDTTCEFWYLPLFATERARAAVITKSRFARIAPVITLDESFQCFSAESRYIPLAESIGLDWKSAKSIFGSYGDKTGPTSFRGYNDTELMLGFCYNTPNSTLPAFWHQDEHWRAIFPRHPKADKL
jgi:hypothetical protein